MYKVEIDYSPVYELITSLYTYLDSTGRQINELGNKWVKDVQKNLDPEFVEELKDQNLEVLHRLNLLVWQCPKKDTIDHFLAWLEELPSSEVYMLLVPWVQHIPRDMIEIHTYFVSLLRKWSQQYFRHLQPEILETLRRDAQQKEKLITKMDPVELVEMSTNGIQIVSPHVKKLLLIPQYHQSPFSVTDYYDGLITCLYPVDVNDSDSSLPKKIGRQLKSLSDDKRLQILRYLHAKPRTFSEIQQFTRLSKSNTHYHIKLLRTSGLIRAYHNSVRVESYSLREGTITHLHDVLTNYVKGD